jgi:GTPase SAR1 family protein
MNLESNPFRTGRIQPGALEFQFLNADDMECLVQKFLSLPSRRALIVGPHGSGKSTLVEGLVKELRRDDGAQRIHLARFSTSQSAWAILRSSTAAWKHGDIVILDGYEQLSWLAGQRVAWTVFRKSMRLLATSHQPIRGFDILWRTQIEESLAEKVILELLGGREPWAKKLLASAEWKASRKKHGANLRESLFDMYDWWQQQSMT